MKKLFKFVVVAAVALTGCSKEPCTEYDDSIASYVKKYATVCHPDVSYIRPSADVLEQCNTDSHTFCTDADRAYIESLTDCLNKLPVCTSANKEAFDSQAQQCSTALEGKRLSDDCKSIGRKVFIQ